MKSLSDFHKKLFDEETQSKDFKEDNVDETEDVQNDNNIEKHYHRRSKFYNWVSDICENVKINHVEVEINSKSLDERTQKEMNVAENIYYAPKLEQSFTEFFQLFRYGVI